MEKFGFSSVDRGKTYVSLPLLLYTVSEAVDPDNSAGSGKTVLMSVNFLVFLFRGTDTLGKLRYHSGLRRDEQSWTCLRDLFLLQG